MRIFTKGTSLFCLLMCIGFTAWAQPDLSGSEAVVNSTTANRQGHVDVAQAPDGRYVIVWESDGQDGDGYGIFAQRYSAGGVAQGSEIQINTTTTSDQRMPAIAMAHNGNFAVAWMSYEQDGDGWGVYHRLFDSTGTNLTNELRANTGASFEQKNPDVAMDSAGNYVVVFEDETSDGDFDIYYRPVTSAGVHTASSTIINTTTTGHQINPTVSMANTGEWVVAWQSNNGTDGDGNGIYFQRFDNSNSTVGSETQANTTTAGNQQAPHVGMDDDGLFTIIWSSFAQDGDGYGIYAQRYNASGVAQGSETLVNTTTTNWQDQASITRAGTGSYAVAWSSFAQDGDKYGVYLQAFTSTGTALGSEAIVNDRTSDFQQLPAIAWTEDSTTLVAAWQSGLRSSTSTQDASDYGIVQKLAPVSTKVRAVITRAVLTSSNETLSYRFLMV